MFMQAESTLCRFPAEAFITKADAETYGRHVGVYEADDIARHPPDVIVVGREEGEPQVKEIWRQLSNIKPVALVAMSGCFQSNFTWSMYRGVLCSDYPSRVIARYNDIPAIRYFETFDPETFPPAEWRYDQSANSIFHIKSYINQYPERFPLAYRFWCDCAQVLHDAFGEKVSIKNVDGQSYDDVRKAMIESAVTLHIKDQEGLGWSVLESLATGRPIITQAGFSRNMAFNEWILPGTSGYLIQTPQDVVPIIGSFMEHPSLLRAVQVASAEFFRNHWEGAELAQDLGLFLEDIYRAEEARWFPERPEPALRQPVKPWRPSLDPTVIQDYERLI